MGSFMHAVEDEMLCQSLMPDKVPYFNAVLLHKELLMLPRRSQLSNKRPRRLLS